MAADATAAESGWPMRIEAIMTGVRDWRIAHPQATFTEIEAAIDERLSALRACMIQETALALLSTAPSSPPACPACAGPLQPRGLHDRQVRVQGNHSVRLRRPYLVCTRCGRGIFPPG